LLEEAGATNIRSSASSRPLGIATVGSTIGVSIYTPVVDHRLNGTESIVPGLGDFGDRLYGTV
jgi:uracil phosphoribosyltransferase